MVYGHRLGQFVVAHAAYHYLVFPFGYALEGEVSVKVSLRAEHLFPVEQQNHVSKRHRLLRPSVDNGAYDGAGAVAKGCLSIIVGKA